MFLQHGFLVSLAHLHQGGHVNLVEGRQGRRGVLGLLEPFGYAEAHAVHFDLGCMRVRSAVPSRDRVGDPPTLVSFRVPATLGFSAAPLLESFSTLPTSFLVSLGTSGGIPPLFLLLSDGAGGVGGALSTCSSGSFSFVDCSSFWGGDATRRVRGFGLQKVFWNVKTTHLRLRLVQG